MLQRFKLKDKNKSQVNLWHLAYYILLQIIYIDNKYNIYRAPKIKYKKYPIRMYWVLKDLKYKNAKYIHRQHPTEQQDKVDLILKLGRFLIEECLNR